jgi:hypothetical protein
LLLPEQPESKPQSVKDEKIKDFYAQLLNDISKTHSADDKLNIEFNPEEQDEENYQFHNENLNYYPRSDDSQSLIEHLNEE